MVYIYLSPCFIPKSMFNTPVRGNQGENKWLFGCFVWVFRCFASLFRCFVSVFRFVFRCFAVSLVRFVVSLFRYLVLSLGFAGLKLKGAEIHPYTFKVWQELTSFLSCVFSPLHLYLWVTLFAPRSSSAFTTATFDSLGFYKKQQQQPVRFSKFFISKRDICLCQPV